MPGPARRALAVLFPLVLAALVGIACGRGDDGLRRAPSPPYRELEPALSSGELELEPAFPALRFDQPTRMVHDPTGDRFYLAEREGRVWSFANDEETAEKRLVLDLSATTQGHFDCGLLGLALHPDFGTPGAAGERRLFVWYNHSARPRVPERGRLPWDTPSESRLSRFTLGEDGVADPGSEAVLIAIPSSTALHNGGAMLFHPAERFLYLTVGDDFEVRNAQRLDGGLYAAVLRIDVDCDPRRSHPIRRQPRSGRTQGYCIPDDNPFLDPAGGVLEELWAIGLRSPHAMSFDAGTGRIWVADVGDALREEIDVVEQGGNYEWPWREGTAPGPRSAPATPAGAPTGPVFEYERSAGDNCVIGGAVYRGSAHPDLFGRYLFADNGSNRVWALEPASGGPPAVCEITRLGGPRGYRGGISAFAELPGGELALLRVGRSRPVLRLVRRSAEPAPPPRLLSATGLFRDVGRLEPATGVVPYQVVAPGWHDGATARRWIALPENGDGEIDPERESIRAGGGRWAFPPGTVLAQHLEIALDERAPPGGDAPARRLETRILVVGDGDAYGLTYRWRADGSDAELLPGSASEELEIRGADGRRRRQTWHYPGRGECLACHAPGGDGGSSPGPVLGVNARQLDREIAIGRGRPRAQLALWSGAGMIAGEWGDGPALVDVADESAPVAARARSYLDVNCAHCHQPGGVRAGFDARLETPLEAQALLGATPLNPLGMAGARLVAPGDVARSILYLRLHAAGELAMPPVGRHLVDRRALDVLARWIEELE